MSDKGKTCCTTTETKVREVNLNARRTVIVNTPSGPKTADVINGKIEIVQG